MSSSQLAVRAWPAYRQRTHNPYTAMLYDAVKRVEPYIQVEDLTPISTLRRAAIWHIHWPEIALERRSRTLARARASSFVAAIRFARSRGTRVIWTAHNLDSQLSWHAQLEEAYMRSFVHCVDGVLALTRGGLDAVRDRHPCLRNVPARITPIGHYIDEYPNQILRRDARARFGLAEGQTALVFIGRIARYKGVIELIEAFKQLDDAKAKLIVAGRPQHEALGRHVKQIGEDSRIDLRLCDVPPGELQAYLKAGDLVVAPFTRVSISHPSTAILALSFGKPILVPCKGSLQELAADFAPWVIMYDEPLAADDLARGLDRASQLSSGEELTMLVRERLDWDAIAADTVDLYREVLSNN